MTIQEAIKIVEYASRWRRGEDIEMPNPKEYGIAIDKLIEFSKEQLKKEDERKKN